MTSMGVPKGVEGRVARAVRGFASPFAVIVEGTALTVISCTLFLLAIIE